MTNPWRVSPDDLPISAENIHVWLTPTGLGDDQIAFYKGFLSADEITRANRFAVESKYQEFVVTRGLLKQKLGNVTGVKPDALKLKPGEHDKPFIDNLIHGERVAFNVSHSHGLALVAITLGGRLGVDLEKIREEVEWEGLARRFFSEAEFKALNEQPEDNRMKAFFTCWTRKEAFVKAVGDGVAYGLKEFDVSVDPQASAGLLNVPRKEQGRMKWSMQNIPVNEEYAAALVIDRPDCHVRLWRI